MPSPIIKIKRGTAKPIDYGFRTVGGVLIQDGLTAGEMGVMIDATNQRYAFYIGNTGGAAITYGCEITTATDWTTVSDFKIPTQAAIKGYISTLPQPGGNSTAIISRYHQRGAPTPLDGTLTLPGNSNLTVKFGASDFSVGSMPLSYTSANGIFTNTSSTETLNLLITYQITWDILAAATNYNDLNAVRSAWIQRSGTATQNIFGFNSLIVPPQASTSSGAVSGTQNSSAMITLAPSATFSIQARNHGSISRTIAETSNVNNGSGSAIFFERATNIQIARI